VGVGWWAWGGGAGERDSRGTTFGTLLAAMGLLLTLAGWFFPTTSRRPVKGTSQRAGRGSVQAGGHITGAVATGRGACAAAPSPPPSPTDAARDESNRVVDQQAGAGAVQAAGDITGAVATGKNAQASGSSRPSDEAQPLPDSDPPGTS
ncbi:MAG: hypothetical protein WBM00_07650, partial [Solirubrobacterales bacterium]